MLQFVFSLKKAALRNFFVRQPLARLIGTRYYYEVIIQGHKEAAKGWSKRVSIPVFLYSYTLVPTWARRDEEGGTIFDSHFNHLGGLKSFGRN